jgi:hypothetical protein
MQFFRTFGAKLFHAIGAGFGILSFCISLVVPFSSLYYANDNKVVDKEVRQQTSEKVEVATNLFNFPAEILHYKTFQGLSSVDPAVLKFSSTHFSLLFHVKPSGCAHFYKVFARELFDWHPSVVIALRRLLI